MTDGTLIALLHGPDQRGLVARTAGWIFERGGNILHADQHRDREERIFFQRIEWQPAGKGGRTANSRALESEASAFRKFASALGMTAKVTAARTGARIALFVSKADHCFHDLVLRARSGEFAGNVELVVSNHRDLESAALHYRLPFHYVHVSPENRGAAERRQLSLLRRHRVDLVVLARYMQVLSENFLEAIQCPAINIHHSFLPAFAGGRPYHQAHARGVKLIGATAHYVTRELDEGPIIHQDVSRVTHRDGIEDLVRIGRDTEKQVLARAVRWHLESRVLAYRNKTVVFD